MYRHEGEDGLRPYYQDELVACWAMPEFQTPDCRITDVIRFQWSTHKPHGHPQEKPVALMEWLMLVSDVNPESVVLDPFAGSGTTLTAAKQLGVSAIGFEENEGCEVAAERLSRGTQSARGRGRLDHAKGCGLVAHSRVDGPTFLRCHPFQIRNCSKRSPSAAITAPRSTPARPCWCNVGLWMCRR